MPDLPGWITQQIDQTEQHARACTATDWRHIGHGTIVDRDTDGWQSAPNDAVITNIGVDRIYYSCSPPYVPDADHIVLHSPDNVLRRCAADRKILTEHRAATGIVLDATWCVGCGDDGDCCDPEPKTSHVNDCPTLLALAEGYGLTEEQRAALERPGTRHPGLPDDAVEMVVVRAYRDATEITDALLITGGGTGELRGFLPRTE